MSGYDEDTDEPWGMWEGQCQACDCYGRVNDLMLCEDCAAKLERDLIRQRDWDYSAAAWGLPPEAREELRRQVIAQFGAALELIAPPEKGREKKKKKNKGPGRERPG
jgi:hypothetical protein